MSDDPKPEQQKPPGAAAGIVASVLGYVDSWFKLAAIVVLFVVGGLGWVTYEQRAALFEALLTTSTTSLDTGAVPAALEKLVADSGADLVQIWSVNLSVNSQRFIAARQRDGERPVTPAPRRLPVVVRSTNVGLLIRVIAGEPACVDLAIDAPSPVVNGLAERGMKRACAIPIPPSPDSFVGVIYMLWSTPPDPGAEEVALVAAREIAGQLVRR